MVRDDDAATAVAVVRQWMRAHGFNPDCVDEASESPGNRSYPHAFRELWYSTAAATPLIEASACGRVDVVEFCLAASPRSVLWRDEFRNSALHVALDRGHATVAAALLRRLGDVCERPLDFARSKNAMGSTPAMLSARGGDLRGRLDAAATKWCVLNGLFDEYDDDEGVDTNAVANALADSPSDLRFALVRWTYLTARDLIALECALVALFDPSAALAGLSVQLGPLIRAFLTNTSHLESRRVRAFAVILADLGYFDGASPPPPPMRNRRHSDHPLYSR